VLSRRALLPRAPPSLSEAACAPPCEQVPALHMRRHLQRARVGPQDAPTTNKYLLEGALSGGPNNGAVETGPATFDQGSCECAPQP